MSSRERELLKKIDDYFLNPWDGDEELKLSNEIKELLAEPETEPVGKVVEIGGSLASITTGDGSPTRLRVGDSVYASPQSEPDPAIAAIEFALIDQCGLDFLRYWNEGDFDSIREAWPDAPEEVFIGAGPLRTSQPRQPESESVGYIAGYAARIISNGGAWDSFSFTREKCDESDAGIYLHPPRKPETELDWIVGEGLKPITKKDLLMLQQTEPGLATLYDTPLYTNPPRQPVQLSDDELIDILKEYWNPVKFARAVIAAYEEKQSGR